MMSTTGFLTFGFSTTRAEIRKLQITSQLVRDQNEHKHPMRHISELSVLLRAIEANTFTSLAAREIAGSQETKSSRVIFLGYGGYGFRLASAEP